MSLCIHRQEAVLQKARVTADYAFAVPPRLAGTLVRTPTALTLLRGPSERTRAGDALGTEPSAIDLARNGGTHGNRSSCTRSVPPVCVWPTYRSEEHTSELQSL